MKKLLEKLNKKYLEPKGNASLAIGVLFGIGNLTSPCPTCILGSLVFIADGIRKKLGW